MRLDGRERPAHRLAGELTAFAQSLAEAGADRALLERTRGIVVRRDQQPRRVRAERDDRARRRRASVRCGGDGG
jgi:hypothetical protein